VGSRPHRLRARCAIALVVAIAVVAAGCSFNPDPTELNFYVKIVNDTRRPVLVSFCGTAHNLCEGKLYQTGRVNPGGDLPTVQTAVGRSNPWLVRSTAGRRLGCLSLAFDYNADGAVVRVSSAVRCAARYRVREKPAR
jgi:hypothetical protein